MDVLDEPAVRARLHYQDLIPAVADALAALSSGKVVQPVRTVLPVAPHHGFFAVMPAYAGALGAKLVTFYPNNVGVHTHHAVIVMLKPETGEPLAVMDGRLITEMRTAARRWPPGGWPGDASVLGCSAPACRRRVTSRRCASSVRSRKCESPQRAGVCAWREGHAECGGCRARRGRGGGGGECDDARAAGQLARTRHARQRDRRDPPRVARAGRRPRHHGPPSSTRARRRCGNRATSWRRAAR